MIKITIDDFFSIVSLLNGSNEDYQIAVSNLENLKFKDEKIINLLFTKALFLDKRTRFVKSNKNDPMLIGRNLFNHIKANGNNKLYKQILYRIMNT